MQLNNKKILQYSTNRLLHDLQIIIKKFLGLCRYQQLRNPYISIIWKQDLKIIEIIRRQVYVVFSVQHIINTQKVYFFCLLNRSENKYMIIFFNTKCHDSSAYNAFKKAYDCFPITYYTRLELVLLLHSSLKQKTSSILSIGYLHKYLKSRTYFLSKIQELSQFKIKLDQSFQQKIYDQIRIADDPTVKINTSKRIQRTKSKFENIPLQKSLINESMLRSNINPINIQKTRSQLKIKRNNTELIQIVSTFQQNKKQLTNYQKLKTGIPIILYKLIQILKLKPQFLKTQGIFRKQISKQQQNKLDIQLNNKNYEYLNEIKNPFTIPFFIKKFFNQLEQPIFTYNIYKKILQLSDTFDIKNKNNEQIIKKMLQQQLPITNYICLKYLLSFLNKYVIPNQKYNKMNIYALSVMFLPCILRSKQNNISDLIHTKKIIPILEFIMSNYEKIL